MKKGIRIVLLLTLVWCTGIVFWNLNANYDRNSAHCNPDLGLFFVHIQKTGGTTLRSILVDKFIRKNFTSSQYCKAGWQIQKCDQDNLTHDCPGPKQLFSNHIAPKPSTFESHSPRTHMLVTMLRDPLERLVSWYYFLKWRDKVTHNGLQYNITGSEWHDTMENEKESLKTFAIEHRNQACDKLTYYYNCSREKTDKIKEAFVNSYDAVLITEQFDKSMILLIKYMLGFELQTIDELTYVSHKVMQGRPTVADLPPDVLERETAFDQEIYDLGLALFEKKAKQYGEKLEADLREFSIAQEVYKDKCEADTIMGRLNACIKF